MKILYNRLIIFFIIMTLIFGIFYLLLHQTSSARKAKQNMSNSLKIEIGMSKHEVLQIMGNPDDKLISFINSVDSVYYYEPPFAAASGIYIQFDIGTDKVNRIILNE